MKTDGLSFFLAGDTSYTEGLLLERQVDGVSPDEETALRTLDTILRYAQDEPTVYLPSHDSHAAERLRNRAILLQHV